ncbi:MAG TPA: hypothetical protein VNE63_19265 [Candidatus Acidoferrales bacterium]|nr:hypothetical protein [Candidatus Acidoferrales bacterium]
MSQRLPSTVNLPAWWQWNNQNPVPSLTPSWPTIAGMYITNSALFTFEASSLAGATGRNRHPTSSGRRARSARTATDPPPERRRRRGATLPINRIAELLPWEIDAIRPRVAA